MDWFWVQWLDRKEQAIHEVDFAEYEVLNNLKAITIYKGTREQVDHLELLRDAPISTESKSREKKLVLGKMTQVK